MSKDLKKLRKDAGYTQKDIAKKLGVSRNTYLLIENNDEKGRELYASEIVKLCDLYGMSPDVLLGCDQQKSEGGFCETCNVEQKIRELQSLLRSHGHFKSCGHLRKLLDGEIQKDY